MASFSSTCFTSSTALNNLADFTFVLRYLPPSSLRTPCLTRSSSSFSIVCIKTFLLSGLAAGAALGPATVAGAGSGLVAGAGLAGLAPSSPEPPFLASLLRIPSAISLALAFCILLTNNALDILAGDEDDVTPLTVVTTADGSVGPAAGAGPAPGSAPGSAPGAAGAADTCAECRAAAFSAASSEAVFVATVLGTLVLGFSDATPAPDSEPMLTCGFVVL